MLAQRFLSKPFRLVILGLLAPIAASSPATATLIIVPDDVPTIQVAITAAANGDSILVRAGTYAESLTLTGKNVTIFGEPPAGATISGLDSYRIMDISGPSVTTSTVFEDLTLRQGKALTGAGIRLSSGASLTLRRCRFIDNLAEGQPFGAAGGAIILDANSTLIAESCRFQDNSAVELNFSGDGIGGAIEALAGSHIEIRSSEFINNRTSGFEGGFGGAIDVQGFALVEDCRFSQGFGWEGGGIHAGLFIGERQRPGHHSDREHATPDPVRWESAPEIVVRGCQFDRNEAWTGGGIYCNQARMTVENNTFFDNRSWFGIDAAIVAFNSPGTISNNTVSFNQSSGIGLQIWNQAPITVRNNVVSNNYMGIIVHDGPIAGSVACNDVWSNLTAYGGDSPDLTGIDGNIAKDPMFCNPQARDFTLNALSPCAPPHSPPSCELIGAWPVACGLAAIGLEGQPAMLARLTVIPNPVRGIARFEIGSAAPSQVLHIFDLQGRLVEQIEQRDGRWEWSPKVSVPAGVYFARFELESATPEAVKFLYLR